MKIILLPFKHDQKCLSSRSYYLFINNVLLTYTNYFIPGYFCVATICYVSRKKQ